MTIVRMNTFIHGNLTSTSWASFGGAVETQSSMRTPSIELTSSTLATPYIDFHYANSSADYTSRIIQNAAGLSIDTASLSLSSPLSVANGGTGSTAPGAAQRALKVAHLYTEITASSADDYLTKALAYILTEAQNTGWNTFITGPIAWAGTNVGYYMCVVYAPTVALGVQIINPSAYGITWWTYWNGTWTRRKPS